MQIVFDARKRALNILKHGGLDFDDLDVEFFQAAKLSPARDDRFFATGLFDGNLITVVFRPLGREGVSVISMRPARRRESCGERVPLRNLG